MEVTYENNLEDIVALTEHQLSTNAAYHKRRRWDLSGGPLLVLAPFALFAWALHRPAFLLPGAIGTVVAFLWNLRHYRHVARKAVEKLQREKPQKEVLCAHIIAISADGCSEHTAESRHFHTWSALFDVAFTPDHIFVYNTSATAHIIPRRELGDAQFQDVCDEIRKYWDA